MTLVGMPYRRSPNSHLALLLRKKNHYVARPRVQTPPEEFSRVLLQLAFSVSYSIESKDYIDLLREVLCKNKQLATRP